MDILPAGFNPDERWPCPTCKSKTKGMTCQSCETLCPAIPQDVYEKYKEAESARLRSKLFGSSAPVAQTSQTFTNSAGTLFGTSTSGSSLFGTNNATSGSLFGTNNASTGASLFGTNNATSSGSLFGTPNTTGSIFSGSSSSMFTSDSIAAGSSIGFTFKESESVIPHRDSKAVASPAGKEKEGYDPIGLVYIHGNGECDQLGMGDVRERRKPTKMPGLAEKKVVLMAAGAMHSVVLTAEGEVYSWGCNDAGALGRLGVEEQPMQVPLLPRNVKKIACGDSHTVALLSDGRVYGFGRYSDSQGAIGFPPTSRAEGLSHTKAPLELDQLPCRMTAIATGNNHTAAIGVDGMLYMWGDSESGQLGIPALEGGKQKSLLKPLVRSGKEIGLECEIADVFCTPSGTWVVDHQGNVVTTGINTFGQLGLGTTVNVVEKFSKNSSLSSLNSKVVSICGSIHHTMALTADGKVFTWGVGSICGLNKKTPVLLPTEIKGLDRVRSISCGANHAMVVTTDGGIWTFGQGDNFQCGNATPQEEIGEDVPIPYFMDSKQLEATFILSAVGGVSHACELGWLEGSFRSPQEREALYASSSVALEDSKLQAWLATALSPAEEESTEAFVAIEHDLSSDWSGDEDDRAALLQPLAEQAKRAKLDPKQIDFIRDLFFTQEPIQINEASEKAAKTMAASVFAEDLVGE